MLLVSTGFKSALLGPQSFAQIFEGGQLRIFAGVRPSSANLAEPISPIAVIERTGSTSPALRFQQANDFVIKPPGDPWQLRTLSPGTAIWWRLVSAADDAGNSLSSPRIDGDIGITAAPNDMTLSVTSFSAGDVLPIDNFLYTLPPLA